MWGTVFVFLIVLLGPVSYLIYLGFFYEGEPLDWRTALENFLDSFPNTVVAALQGLGIGAVFYYLIIALAKREKQ